MTSSIDDESTMELDQLPSVESMLGFGEDDDFEDEDVLRQIEIAQEAIDVMEHILHDVKANGGVCRQHMASLEAYLPGMIDEYYPLESYTLRPSHTNLSVTLEKITINREHVKKGLIALLVAAIAKLLHWLWRKLTGRALPSKTPEGIADRKAHYEKMLKETDKTFDSSLKAKRDLDKQIEKDRKEVEKLEKELAKLKSENKSEPEVTDIREYVNEPKKALKKDDILIYSEKELEFMVKVRRDIAAGRAMRGHYDLELQKKLNKFNTLDVFKLDGVVDAWLRDIRDVVRKVHAFAEGIPEEHLNNREYIEKYCSELREFISTRSQKHLKVFYENYGSYLDIPKEATDYTRTFEVTEPFVRAAYARAAEEEERYRYFPEQRDMYDNVMKFSDIARIVDEQVDERQSFKESHAYAEVAPLTDSIGKIYNDLQSNEEHPLNRSPLVKSEITRTMSEIHKCMKALAAMVRVRHTILEYIEVMLNAYVAGVDQYVKDVKAIGNAIASRTNGFKGKRLVDDLDKFIKRKEFIDKEVEDLTRRNQHLYVEIGDPSNIKTLEEIAGYGKKQARGGTRALMKAFKNRRKRKIHQVPKDWKSPFQ